MAITPHCQKTILLKKEEAKKFIDQHDTVDVSHFGTLTRVTYKDNVYSTKGKWRPPMNTAPQISAAITAYARIKMYPFINRDDFYYTDTDSVVLSNPLPEEEVSGTELGKNSVLTLTKEFPFSTGKVYGLVLNR